jgi:NAD(P)-dependent dehydrogenase (short-subunit alcohol dehydrogenase family)
MIDFTEQVVLVTGAGRGLGRQYALDLARRGASVVVNDLGTSMNGAGSDGGVADEVVAEIEDAGGVAIASYESVETPDSAASIVRTAVDRFGRLDAVVSNAGIFHTLEFDQLTPEHYQRMRAVHLDGGFYLSQAAFRVMKTQGYGRFVFISSSAGLFGQPNSAHYAAAKAGLVGLANVIAIEGADYGILANTVLPFGFSRMVTDTVGGDADSLRRESEFLRSIAPELVVPVVVFLASQTCTFTHHIYSAMAGRFARVFIGLGNGWEAERGTFPTAEDVADHFDQLSSTEPFTVPMSIFDEISLTVGRLGITS